MKIMPLDDNFAGKPLALAASIERLMRESGYPIATAPRAAEVNLLFYVDELVTIVNALHAAHAAKMEST